MSQGLRMTVRFLLVVAVVISTAYLFAPANSTSSPYTSALSVLVAPPSFAAMCPNHTCNFMHNPPNCLALADNMKCKVTGQGCFASQC